MEIDYDTRIALGALTSTEDPGWYAADLRVRRATKWEQHFLAHWSNPELAYYVPFRLAAVSVILGGIGFLIGVTSLVISLTSR